MNDHIPGRVHALDHRGMSAVGGEIIQGAETDMTVTTIHTDVLAHEATITLIEKIEDVDHVKPIEYRGMNKHSLNLLPQ